MNKDMKIRVVAVLVFFSFPLSYPLLLLVDVSEFEVEGGVE